MEFFIRYLQPLEKTLFSSDVFPCSNVHLQNIGTYQKSPKVTWTWRVIGDYCENLHVGMQDGQIARTPDQTNVQNN